MNRLFEQVATRLSDVYYRSVVKMHIAQLHSEVLHD